MSRVTCSCYSHNGFLTRKGLADMKGHLPATGLTGAPEPVSLDEEVSVSASEPSRVTLEHVDEETGEARSAETDLEQPDA